jgi:hypothetical protein
VWLPSREHVSYLEHRIGRTVSCWLKFWPHSGYFTSVWRMVAGRQVLVCVDWHMMACMECVRSDAKSTQRDALVLTHI